MKKNKGAMIALGEESDGDESDDSSDDGRAFVAKCIVIDEAGVAHVDDGEDDDDEIVEVNAYTDSDETSENELVEAVPVGNKCNNHMAAKDTETGNINPKEYGKPLIGEAEVVHVDDGEDDDDEVVEVNACTDDVETDEEEVVTGKEGAGIIKSVGDGVTGLKVGDRVMVQVEYGAYAQEILADESQCYPVPEGVSLKRQPRSASPIRRRISRSWSGPRCRRATGFSFWGLQAGSGRQPCSLPRQWAQARSSAA